MEIFTKNIQNMLLLGKTPLTKELIEKIGAKPWCAFSEFEDGEISFGDVYNNCFVVYIHSGLGSSASYGFKRTIYFVEDFYAIVNALTKKEHDVKLFTKEDLINLCQYSIVDNSLWKDRDTSTAQIGVGICLALLHSNCRYEITSKKEDFIDIKFWVKDFTWFEICEQDEENYPDGVDSHDYEFYLPTWEHLLRKNGEDWYV